MENFEAAFGKFEKAITEGLEVSLSMKKIGGGQVACSIKGSVNDRSLIGLAIISSLAQLINVDAIDLIDVLADNVPKLKEADYEDEVPEEFQETLKDLGIEVKQVSDDKEDDDEDEEIEELAKLIAKALKDEM
ncbi:hypothetical protein H6A05_02105 [Megasphaera elsdenii]|uniref:hypothetical protein n=1 Tax=Megasphaera elsdenii TaxID=907 RepID=UPI0019569F6A|nr:hypothetical protein [Megasphaera elsdenii]MBM6701120.1 hypothetical protein [Megasphaera elsdenii]